VNVLQVVWPKESFHTGAVDAGIACPGGCSAREILRRLGNSSRICAKLDFAKAPLALHLQRDGTAASFRLGELRVLSRLDKNLRVFPTDCVLHRYVPRFNVS